MLSPCHRKPGLLTCLPWIRASARTGLEAGGVAKLRHDGLTGRCLQLGSEKDFQDLLGLPFPSWAGHNLGSRPLWAWLVTVTIWNFGA